jgi:hypothetical protein
MANRYSTLVFQRTIGAGVTDTFAQALSVSSCNIVKIKVSPSIPVAPTEFFIYKDLTYAAADIVYATKQYTGFLVDPVEDDGVAPIERNEGFVCAYEDKQMTNAIYFKIINGHSAQVIYTVVITYDIHVQGSELVSGVPSGLIAVGSSLGSNQKSTVFASENNATIDDAEFRAKFIAAGSPQAGAYDMRTVAEGGTFVDNGTTQLIFTGVLADMNGAQNIWIDANIGTWFFTWKLHNTFGWSRWTDGNETPSDVRSFFRTGIAADVAPPSSWSVTLEYGPSSNTVICRATRPDYYANQIDFFAVQLLDADTGSWKTLFEGSDVDHMRLDGRAISYSLSANKKALIDPSSSGWGTAVAGDLVLVDVRGSVWDEQYCQWARINTIIGNIVYLSDYLDPQVTSDLRIIIIKPPWNWTTGGYLGGTAGKGFWPKPNQNQLNYYGDKETKEFVSSAMMIPNTVTNPEARVWFSNPYCRSDNTLTHSTGLLGLPSVRKWININDPNWFVPIYGKGDFATVSFNSAGKCVIAGVNPQPAYRNQSCIWGVKSRFLLYPDANGIIKIRARFTDVTLPIGTISRHYFGLFIGCCFRRGDWYDIFDPACVQWKNRGTNALIRFDQGKFTAYDGYLGLGDSTYYLDIIRPAPGYTVDLIMGFGEKSSGSYRYSHILSQYSLNGGAYISPPAVDDGEFVTQPMAGAEFIIGLASQAYSTSTGAYPPPWGATLSEIEIIQGTIAQNRIQGSGNPDTSEGYTPFVPKPPSNKPIRTYYLFKIHAK